MRISIGCGPYDRTAALRDGRVRTDPLEVDYVTMTPGETFWRQLKHGDFDVSEMSLSAFISLIANDDDRFVGLPIFPFRGFRHSNIFVNAHAEITRPEDLSGKRIGVPEYHMTSALYVRGLLADEYGFDLKSAIWVQGGQEVPGRQERITLSLPPEIRLETVTDQTLSDMLDEGGIDGLFTPVAPSCFARGSNNVKRLFQDSIKVESDYFVRTKIFPIMHLMVLKRDLYERSSWIAQELVKAFDEAKRICFNDILLYDSMMSSLPWFTAEVERTFALLGSDYWSYGVEPNRATLGAALRYSHDQGLSHRRVEIEELFASSTLDSFVE